MNGCNRVGGCYKIERFCCIIHTSWTADLFSVLVLKTWVPPNSRQISLLANLCPLNDPQSQSYAPLPTRHCSWSDSASCQGYMKGWMSREVDGDMIRLKNRNPKWKFSSWVETLAIQNYPRFLVSLSLNAYNKNINKYCQKLWTSCMWVYGSLRKSDV